MKKFRYGFWDFMEEYGLIVIGAVLVTGIFIAGSISEAIVEAAKYKCK